MRTAILIHGHNLQAKEWEQIVWGSPREGIYGRASRGIQEALRFDAEVILFGTGGSEKDGLLEGEYTLAYTKKHIEDIPELNGVDAQAWLSERAVLERESMDTDEEIVAGARLAVAHGCERLVLVSSPTHILRCHKEAIAAFSTHKEFRHLLHNLYAVASDVSYAGFSVEDVVIIEPPHRPDRADAHFFKTLKGLIPFFNHPEAAERLNKDLEATIEKHRILLP